MAAITSASTDASYQPDHTAAASRKRIEVLNYCTQMQSLSLSLSLSQRYPSTHVQMYALSLYPPLSRSLTRSLLIVSITNVESQQVKLCRFLKYSLKINRERDLKAQLGRFAEKTNILSSFSPRSNLRYFLIR